MTPAAQYAQKRAEAVELIRKHAPTRLQDALIELLRPAIALCATRADDSQIPLGASKFGGAPDIAPNFEWPMWNDKPLGFLAQINLEEVAAFAEDLLPKSGLLSFFFNWEDWSGTGEDMCRILWLDSPEMSRSNLTGESEVTVPCGQFSIEFFFDIQTPRSLASENFDLAYLSRPESWSKILGYGDEVEGAPISSFYHSVNHQPWHLLLQLWLPDFLDAGQNFGEAFVLYFSISPDDLRERRFHKTQFEVGAS